MKNRWSSEELVERVESDLLFEKQHWLLLASAVLVGCIGLNLNSIPMILGAKLLSPLMPAIVGIAFGASLLDASLFKHSLKILTVQVLAILVLATLYFWWTPLQGVRAELENQASPTLWNILIAFIGGLVGAVGMRRKEVHHLGAGVTLATSLVPPLCATGYGLARGDVVFATGALYLFVLNVFFIVLGHYLVSHLLGEAERLGPKVALVSMLLLIFSFLLVFPANRSADRLIFEEEIQMFVAQEFSHYTIVNQTYDAGKQELKLVIVGRELTQSELAVIEDRQGDYGLREIDLVVEQVVMSAVVKGDN